MRRGFTFVELCLGLVTTSLVLGATAAFLTGVANAWKASGDAQLTVAESTQTHLKLSNFLQSCNAVGACDSSTILVWRADTNGDGAIQSSELAALAYDSTAKVIQLQFPTVTGPGDGTWSAGEFYHASAPTVFKSLSRSSRVVLARVSSANFAVMRGTGAIARPTIEFDLTVLRDTQTRRHYGSVTLRKPVDPL